MAESMIAATRRPRSTRERGSRTEARMIGTGRRARPRIHAHGADRHGKVPNGKMDHVVSHMFSEMKGRKVELLGPAAACVAAQGCARARETRAALACADPGASRSDHRVVPRWLPAISGALADQGIRRRAEVESRTSWHQQPRAPHGVGPCGACSCGGAAWSDRDQATGSIQMLR